MDGQEKREFPRISVNISVEIVAGEKYHIKGLTKDLSVKGVFIACDNKLAVGTECNVLLYLAANEKRAPRIQVQGVVARQTEEGMGIQFDDEAIRSFSSIFNLLNFKSLFPDSNET